MQDHLFSGGEDDQPVVDETHDPYAEVDAAGGRIAEDYGIDAKRAADMVLAHGSERAARRALDRRWWVTPNQRAA